MSASRYVVMANGKGLRWGNHLGIPKHLIEVHGERLLDRIVRQVSSRDPHAEIVISAKDPRYETPGARRHVPLRDEFEIDRFVPELITDDVCFLYGDTFYTDEAVDKIVSTPTKSIAFFGNDAVIVAVKSASSDTLAKHLRHLRHLCERGDLAEAKGWHLYKLHFDQPLRMKPTLDQLVSVDGWVHDLGTPGDWDSFSAQLADNSPKGVRCVNDG